MLRAGTRRYRHRSPRAGWYRRAAPHRCARRPMVTHAKPAALAHDAHGYPPVLEGCSPCRARSRADTDRYRHRSPRAGSSPRTPTRPVRTLPWRLHECSESTVAREAHADRLLQLRDARQASMAEEAICVDENAHGVGPNQQPSAGLWHFQVLRNVEQAVGDVRLQENGTSDPPEERKRGAGNATGRGHGAPAFRTRCQTPSNGDDGAFSTWSSQLRDTRMATHMRVSRGRRRKTERAYQPSRRTWQRWFASRRQRSLRGRGSQQRSASQLAARRRLQ